MSNGQPKRRRWVRLAFGVVGAGFLVAALASQWDEVRESIVLSPLRTGIALVFTLASIKALGHAWSALLPASSDSRRMRRVFYLAQPAKYIPGGIAQPVGQVVLTTDEGVPVVTTVTAFVVHALTGAAAGAFLGAGVSLLSDAPTWLRICALAGLAAPLVLWRPLLLRAARLLTRWTRRAFSEDQVPKQRDIYIAFAWAVAGILGSSLAFATLAVQSTGVPIPALATAFSLAFTVGYLAVPFPSGLAIREGVLALCLPAVGLPTLVAISAIHRVVTMAAEFVMLGTTRFSSPRTAETSTPSESTE